jgi:hypothetical protein
MSCNKEKGEEKGREKGKNECSKNICNKRKFTLVLTLKFESGKTEKLKSHFISKSSQGGCDLPNEKPFKRARKKLLDKWTKSQKIEGTTKTTDKLNGINTQVSSTVSRTDGKDTCTKCSLKNNFYEACGCCSKNAKINNSGRCTDGECDYC